jgi:hypothetical protein
MKKFVISIEDYIQNDLFNSFEEATKAAEYEIKMNDVSVNDVIIYEVSVVYKAKVNFSWKPEE